MNHPCLGGSYVPSFPRGFHGELESVQGGSFEGPRGAGHHRVGHHVRGAGDEEGLGPFEGLHPFPNGCLGNPMPFFFYAHPYPSCLLLLMAAMLIR